MDFGLKKVTQNKKTMSVSEMRKLLGLSKTESYYILKKHYFKTVTVNGHFRVDIESFEDWYNSQWHYQKVDGPPPGSNLTEYMTIDDFRRILGLNIGCADWLIRESSRFRLYHVNGKTCILRCDFEHWYSKQNKYNKINGEPPGMSLYSSYSAREIAEILNIPLRNSVYELTAKKLTGVFNYGINCKEKKQIRCGLYGAG